LAINILVICDITIPSSNPTPNEINPIINVSINNITIAPGETISSVEGEITFTVYYGATVRPYEEPKFDVDLGRDNLFN